MLNLCSISMKEMKGRGVEERNDRMKREQKEGGERSKTNILKLFKN